MKSALSKRYHRAFRDEVSAHHETQQLADHRLKTLQDVYVDQANLQRSYKLLEEHFAILLKELDKRKNCGQVKRQPRKTV